uniref:Uncharacterized protein n=1 Tax=Anopheles farauti TaxID=69004 RepID=A0A182QFM4_9DIPT
MRSRTEMVTNTIDGSDYEEESDFEDSGEDWRPNKDDPKAMKRKTRDILTGAVSGKRGSGRSNGKQKRGRKSAAKGRAAGGRKQHRSADDGDSDEDDEDDDQFDSEDSGSSTPPVPKRGRKSQTGKTPQRGRKSGSSKTSPSTSKTVKMSPGSSASAGGGGGLDSSGSELTVKPIQRKVVNVAGSFPDKSGYLKLFVSRADLEEGIRDNLKVCLWRRDGSSLLQKYFRDKSVDSSTPQFTSSMVYSCWEEKRADEYMEVKVRCIEQSKQLRVQIIDVDAVECRAKEEYQKYIEKHGKPTDGSASDSEQTANGNGAASASSGAREAKRSDDENGADENEGDDDVDGDEEDEMEDDAQEE